MNGKPDGTNARAEARAELVCREVREDIVALQRDELSPLRAESIRRHLASCAECREEALGLELASRDLTKLPELAPPAGLIEATMRRVASEGGGEWLKHEADAKPGAGLAASERPCPAASSPRPADPAPSRAEGFVVALRRPVRNPFVRVAAAALLLIGVMILRNDRVVDAAARAQQRILGPRVSEAVDEARDAFLEKLHL
jgi:hypothetical protein